MMPAPLAWMDRDTLVAVLAGVSIAALLWLALFARRSPRDKLRQRISSMTPPDEDSRAGSSEGARRATRGAEPSPILHHSKSRTSEVSRNPAISRGKLAGGHLPRFIRQSNLNWTPLEYMLWNVLTGIVAFSVLYFLGVRLSVALLVALFAGIGILYVYLSIRRARNLRAFSDGFPGAVDVIARGLRAGLPFQDCLRAVADEAEEPVRSAFGRVLADNALGLSISECVDRMAERYPLTEVRFFAIVVGIQTDTGGSLAEAFENLSETLHGRRVLADKIRTMSQEARSSAMIIGSLPFFVGFALFITSPDYMGVLYSTTAGLIALGISAVWMGMGVTVMRSMINFEA